MSDPWVADDSKMVGYGHSAQHGNCKWGMMLDRGMEHSERGAKLWDNPSMNIYIYNTVITITIIMIINDNNNTWINTHIHTYIYIYISHHYVFGSLIHVCAICKHLRCRCLKNKSRHWMRYQIIESLVNTSRRKRPLEQCCWTVGCCQKMYRDIGL